MCTSIEEDGKCVRRQRDIDAIRHKLSRGAPSDDQRSAWNFHLQRLRGEQLRDWNAAERLWVEGGCLHVYGSTRL